MHPRPRDPEEPGDRALGDPDHLDPVVTHHDGLAVDGAVHERKEVAPGVELRDPIGDVRRVEYREGPEERGERQHPGEDRSGGPADPRARGKPGATGRPSPERARERTSRPGSGASSSRPRAAVPGSGRRRTPAPVPGGAAAVSHRLLRGRGRGEGSPRPGRQPHHLHLDPGTGAGAGPQACF